MPARNIFAGLGAWPKTLRDFVFSDACLAAIWGCRSGMAEYYPFRPYWIQHILCRVQECASPRQRRAVVPGHPIRRRLFQLLGVPLQLIQIVERIGAVQLAGVNQAHEQIADTSPVASLVKQRVLAMQDGLLQ